MQLMDWLSEGAQGPGAFRFVLQPAIAIALAIRDGLRDARAGDRPFVYRLMFAPGERRGLLHSAWRTVALPLLVAFVVDSVLQMILTGHYRARASVAVGLLLVGLPYTIARGLACRAGTRRLRRRAA